MLLLQAYLMFGDERYLSMFTELYVATMRHMQVNHRGQLRGQPQHLGLRLQRCTAAGSPGPWAVSAEAAPSARCHC
jgi:hypothetical protein